MFPKPFTYRSEKYKAWIRTQGCCYRDSSGIKCNHPAEPHHVRKAEFNSGTSHKPHDYVCIPLCRDHHSPLKEKQIPVYLEIIEHLMKYIEEIGG